ncbi:MAG: hypothetical protein JXA99_07955 [Candidatus Lokiarchaeota archaeon]|nr:hypothetical protein [Candidatus Lokiarchaeota archaeon]
MRCEIIVSKKSKDIDADLNTWFSNHSNVKIQFINQYHTPTAGYISSIIFEE